MEHRAADARNLLLFIAILSVTLVNSSSFKPHRHSKREFVSTPKDQVVLLDEPVSLECMTSLKDPMTWYFSSSDGSFHGDIYYAEVFIDPMKPRYRMDTSRIGRYSLVIPKVDRGHAGQYRCDDDEGLVKGEPVELTVLESRPSCIDSPRPGRVICSINAVGSLQLNVTCQHRPDIFPARKLNVNVFSKEFETDEARTCRVCFTRGVDEGCVFETTFEGIQVKAKSELKDHLGATIAGKPDESNVTGVSVTLIVIVVIVLPLAIACGTVLYIMKIRRDRHSQDMDPMNDRSSQALPESEELRRDPRQEDIESRKQGFTKSLKLNLQRLGARSPLKILNRT